VMKARYGVDTMPETAENVAAEFHVSREDQDMFAFRSQRRTVEAMGKGLLAEEIAPVKVLQNTGSAVQVAIDEQPRSDTTLDALAKLKPVVRPDGCVTAGNSSGINDGAVALLIASEKGARRHGLTPRVRILAAANMGIAPRIMGMGPIAATHKLMDRLRLAITDFDIIELNEAFASQSLAVLRGLGLADDAANVNALGGAIALGHPLGASGARLVTTALNQLERGGGRRALCTMCIGVGQGIAMVIERTR